MDRTPCPACTGYQAATEAATRRAAEAELRAAVLEAQLALAIDALMAEERAQELSNTSDDKEAIFAATGRADELRRKVLGLGTEVARG